VTLIEATGGPVACSKCGRGVPAGDAEGWGSLFLNGRLVLVTCPDCLTDFERAQVGERDGASLYEVAAGRRTGGAELGALVADARAAGRRAPRAGWAEDLEETAVGVVAAEPADGWLLVLFAGSRRGGEHRIGLVEVAPERWLGLEQVMVPLWVQERARALAGGGERP
jgi:hypothetical protein